MVMLFLEDTGHLNGRSRVLSVGAGDERMLFWLTNHVGTMVATDIYGEGAFAVARGEPVDADRPCRPRSGLRVATRAPGGSAHGRPQARVRGRQLRRRVHRLLDRALWLAQRRSPRPRPRSGGFCAPGAHAVIVTECALRMHPLNSAPADLALRVATLSQRRRRATLRRRAALGEVLTPARAAHADHRAVRARADAASELLDLTRVLGQRDHGLARRNLALEHRRAVPAGADADRAIGVHVGLHRARQARAG